MTAKIRLLLISCILAVTSIFQMGYTNAYPNTAILSFREYLNESSNNPDGMSDTEFEWIWSAILNIYFVGFAIGSCICASVADRIGRKWTLFIGNLGNLASTLFALSGILTYSPLLFLFSRLVMSLFSGISMSSLILLLQESAPNEMKGVVSFNAEMAYVVTNMLGALAGMQNVFGKNLVLLIGVSCAPTLISVILVMMLHESPRYLVLTKNDLKGAVKSLKFYQRLEDDSVKHTIEDIKTEGSQTTEKSSLGFMLKTPHLRKGFLLGVATMQLTTSIFPIVFYSTDFLTRAGTSYELAESVSTTMLFVSSISTLVGMIIVERLPRKWLLITCAIVNISALLIFATCAMLQTKFTSLSYGCIVALILHGISYSAGLGPIAWFITSELVPLQCRSLAQSLSLAINHTIALVITFLTFPLYTIFGPFILVLLFVVPGYFCIIVLIIYLPETRNVHINDVILKLQGKPTRQGSF